jgi:hypothetical protein
VRHCRGFQYSKYLYFCTTSIVFSTLQAHGEPLEGEEETEPHEEVQGIQEEETEHGKVGLKPFLDDDKFYLSFLCRDGG